MQQVMGILHGGVVNIGGFVVVLGVLVFVHEMGHYLAARWQGVHVEAFSIGFGPAICSWTDRVGTVWKLSWLPLGGYVKLHGQERPEDATSEQRAAWLPGRTYNEKPVGARAIVIAAGPAANFLLATVLFSALFVASGRPYATAVIGQVTPGGAAARAGLMTGDRVERIDDASIARFEDMQRIVSANPGKTVQVVIERNGAAQTMPVAIGRRAAGTGRETGFLGVGSNGVEYERVGPGRAVVEGVKQTWDVSVAILDSVWQLLTGRRSMDEMSGPIGIAKMSGQVVQLGLASLVGFIALLSVNLGVLNLLPIPVLDGGHLLFQAAEAVRGRPLSRRVQEYGLRAGLALLAAEFLFVTWNDLAQLGLFRWISSLGG